MVSVALVGNAAPQPCTMSLAPKRCPGGCPPGFAGSSWGQGEMEAPWQTGAGVFHGGHGEMDPKPCGNLAVVGLSVRGRAGHQAGTWFGGTLPPQSLVSRLWLNKKNISRAFPHQSSKSQRDCDYPILRWRKPLWPAKGEVSSLQLCQGLGQSRAGAGSLTFPKFGEFHPPSLCCAHTLLCVCVCCCSDHWASCILPQNVG